jgi:hypothetical protein
MARAETFDILIAHTPFTFSRFFNQHNELLYEVTHLAGTKDTISILVKKNPTNEVWEITDPELAEQFPVLSIFVDKIITDNESK